MAIYVGLDS